MKKIFSLNRILILLIITGIIFIISGINIFEDPSNRDWTIGAPAIDYTNEIKGFSCLLTGTFFIITGLYLIVRMKDTQ